MSLKIQLSATAAKYLASLDRTTQDRIRKKLAAIAGEPYSAQHSKPLTGIDGRTARVGNYRIIFSIDPVAILVADIAPRGRVYQRLKR